MICLRVRRIIKLNEVYHAFVLDNIGKTHHKKFDSKEEAVEFLQAFGAIITYEEII